MLFQHSSSISSEDDFIDRRLKPFIHRDHYIHDQLRQSDLVNHHEEYSRYSKNQRRKEENLSRIFNIERSRRTFKEIIYRFNETESDDEREYYKFHRSRSARSVSRFRDRNKYHLDMFDSKRDRSSHSAIDVYQACHVTIKYKKDPLSSSKTDQILIKQKQNNDNKTIIVYKGYLKNDDLFSFKSQHLSEYPFDVTFYVNGHIKSHLFICCEYKYRQGGVSLGQLFVIQQIEKSLPCQKCQSRQIKEIPFNSSHRKTLLSDQLSSKNKHTTKSEERINENNELQSIKSIDQNEKTNEQTTNENQNNENVLQSLSSLLQNDFHQMEIPEPLPLRYQGNVENFLVILFGINDNSDLIHSIINFIKIINKIEELNSFVITLQFERIILIVNDQFFQSIEDFSRFYSIYILSNEILSTKKSSNIRGHFSSLELICEQIKEETSIEDNLISIESISETESFCSCQLLKEILLKKDNEGNLKKDFLDYCRFHYNENEVQLNLIDQFEKDFTYEKSIWWFTRKNFIRQMINRALRTKEIDILFKIRFILQNINLQIKQKQFSNLVYRIHFLSFNQIQNLKEQQDGFISFANFLNCTFNQPSTIPKLNQLKTILFRIQTTNGIEIKHLDSKIEVLLPFDNIYLIKSIEEEPNKNYFIINLININQDNQQFKQLTNQMRQQIQSPIVLIELGKLLILNKNYSQIDYLINLLFNDQSFKDNPTLLASIAAIHHLLGSIHNKQNNYRAARFQFEKSLKIFLTFIPEDNQILSTTYNNIGSMFYQEDQHDQAILYHQKALQCQLKSTLPDIEAIITYSANIAAVYLDQAKYHQALIYYQRSLQILQQAIPNQESQTIAIIYDRIASVYWRMDQPDQALPFYEKALQLELEYLPENDHKISVSYFNLSTAYAKLNRLDEAIQSAEKSLQQLLKSVPPDHPEVKENTEHLEGLRRKKWLQQIYQ